MGLSQDSSLPSAPHERGYPHAKLPAGSLASKLSFAQSLRQSTPVKAAGEVTASYRSSPESLSNTDQISPSEDASIKQDVEVTVGQARYLQNTA
eukprot:CAMPEP_0169155090 /NCGR_PEP_ID=MMETSP1015-20121227/53128_1 /TAXON_ID=342587 /ORGANISM="Karlodinium micrum, Strain CCMP2283" /LENGTH=93 /DNA_ID=CAMNT_0009225461 /DNA_START=1 /DNA_END=279 /DNA_ORIENTATION=-